MKKKGHQKVVFKPYDMNQLSLPMSLESIEKVKVEWGLLCITHNISKLATIQWA